MGASASQSFFEKDDTLEVPDAPEHLKALAARLAKAHGIHEAILVQGLVALEPCVQRRLKRAITKPLDLACLRAFKAELEGQETAPDVKAALEGLPSGIKEKVVVLLDSLHLCGGYLPRIGLGTAGLRLYKHFEEGERVHEIAYGYGMRMLDCAGPCPTMPGFDKAFARVFIAEQLADKDLSDFVVVGHPDPFQMGTAPGIIASNLAAHEADMAPMMREGQPLIDVYLGSVESAATHPPRRCVILTQIAFDEVWRECEALYREGKVRSLGVCNISAPQLERLLEFCEIRPAVYEAESHILHHQQAIYDLCQREKIAFLAHTPLGQGSVLDQQSLGHDTLSPAQAALRFNLDRGVSVLPGAEKLSEIEEDQATPLGPPVARVQVPAAPSMLLMAARNSSSRSMANINKMWKALIAPNSDMVERDGHWYGKASEVVRPVRKEVIAQNTAIIEQIRPIIKSLPRKESAETRRKLICAELGKLVGDDRKLGSMVVIPADVFAARDAIPRRSCKDEGPTPQVDASELPEGSKILFFSQRWLTVSHPDDAEGTKRAAIVAAAGAYAKKEGIDLDKVYIWFDLACVEQDDLAELVRGVNALGLYITACDAFVSIDHPEYWSRAWCLVEQEFARCAGVPRFVISSDGTLAPTDHEVTDPRDGNLTVEDDRAAIDLLCLVADDLRSRLYLSFVSQMFSEAQLDEAVGNAWGTQDEALRQNIIET